MNLIKNKIILNENDFADVQPNNFYDELINEIKLNINSSRNRILLLENGEEMLNELNEEVESIERKEIKKYCWNLEFYKNETNEIESNNLENNNIIEQRRTFFVGQRENQITLILGRFVIYLGAEIDPSKTKPFYIGKIVQLDQETLNVQVYDQLQEPNNYGNGKFVETQEVDVIGKIQIVTDFKEFNKNGNK